jgi:hypothetical protein
MDRVIIITSPSKDFCLLIIIRYDLRYYFKCAEHESKKCDKRTRKRKNDAFSKEAIKG